MKTVRVDLPVGLSVNPQATPQCTLADLRCQHLLGAIRTVGESVGDRLAARHPDFAGSPVTQVPVYNIEPPQGQPARFGLHLAGNSVYLEADLACDGDYHEGFTIHVPELPLLEGLILKNRLVFDGRAGDGTFITTPSTCWDPESPPHEHAYSTYLLASSIAEEASPGYSFPQSAEPAIESPLPKGKKPIDCAGVPYAPGLDVDPGTAATDSPAGVDHRSRRSPTSPAATAANQLQHPRSQGRLPAGPRPQPLGGERPGRLHRPAVRQGHRRRRSPVPPARRSARSRSKPRRCRPAR